MAIATDKEVSGGLEWRVTAPEGSSAKMESKSSWIRRIWNGLVEFGLSVKSKVSMFGKKVWKIGEDDPRKVVHGVKVGIALTLVSLFYYARPLYDGVGGSAMWAVMTVVVVFEYTVGGCLYKGINRALATLSAGGLAVGIHWVASKSGEVKPFILSTSVFLLASAATFSRFIPTIKARFDYGVTIFILTFSLVAVSGYRVNELLDLAAERISTIAIGITISMFVCVLVCPVWSGQELHLLISRNMEKLADSLEGCVEYCFVENEIMEKESSSKRSEGYKCVLNSKAYEDSQANLARWEPAAHGRFVFRHPWKQYLQVGAAVRQCAYCVEALHGCLNSEIKAPDYMKKHLSGACTRLSSESSKVLKELSRSINQMRRSSSIDMLVGDMNNAVREIQNALTSLPTQLMQIKDSKPIEATEGKEHGASTAGALLLTKAMPLMTMASLLIEISARVQGVVDAVGVLASIAFFEPISDEKSSSITQITQGQETNDLQEV